MVEKTAHKFLDGGQLAKIDTICRIHAKTNTALTLCMKAVRQNRGRGGEEESARRSDCFRSNSDALHLPILSLLCNCEKNGLDCK